MEDQKLDKIQSNIKTMAYGSIIISAISIFTIGKEVYQKFVDYGFSVTNVLDIILALAGLVCLILTAFFLWKRRKFAFHSMLALFLIALFRWIFVFQNFSFTFFNLLLLALEIGILFQFHRWGKLGLLQ